MFPFPHHLCLSDISSLQLCITGVPDNAVIEGEGPFLNLFALDPQRLLSCSWICHLLLHLTELYWKVKELLKPAS